MYAQLDYGSDTGVLGIRLGGIEDFMPRGSLFTALGFMLKGFGLAL